MPSIINTNIQSLNAQRNLNSSGGALATSLQRLSSGMRINSAKDDAAGLAISDRMTTQIRGLNQASRNANDAISLSQTAEGALSSVGDNLQRIRELAVQAANASNSSVDRIALNNEATQLVAEIQRVATSANFNGVNLLDGTFTAQIFQVGANAGQAISIDSIASAQVTALGVGASSSFLTTLTGGAANGNGLSAGDLSINGLSIPATSSDGVSAYDSRGSGIAIAAAINAAGVGVTATVRPTILAGTTVTGTTAIADKDLLINGVSLGAIATATTTTERGAQMASAINAKTTLTGVTATFNTTTGAVTLSAQDGRNIAISTTSSTLTGMSNTGLAYGANTTSNLTIANKVASGTTSSAISSTGALVAGQFFINGYDVGKSYVDLVASNTITTAGAASFTVQNSNVVTAINALTSMTGVTATVVNNTSYTLTSSNGMPIEEKVAGGAVSSGTAYASFTAQTGLTITQGSSGLNQYVTRTLQGAVNLTTTSSNGLTVASVSGTAAAATGLTVGYKAPTLTAASGVSAVDLTTATGATTALTVVDAALASINSSRAALGAYQNRFVAVIANLAINAENLTASRSRITDTDFAAETAALSRAQILQQAGTAMLAQANSLPNTVLQLLK